MQVLQRQLARTHDKQSCRESDQVACEEGASRCSAMELAHSILKNIHAWNRRPTIRSFAGILCSDRFSAYFKYHKGLAQLCWAHLKRNILGIQDFAKTTDAQRFCRDALALYARLFRLWRKFQGSLIDRDQLIAPLDSAAKALVRARRAVPGQ